MVVPIRQPRTAGAFHRALGIDGQFRNATREEAQRSCSADVAHSVSVLTPEGAGFARQHILIDGGRSLVT